MRKEFLSCKKSGLKSGAITDAATLQSTCMNASGTGIPDVKGKIQKACSEKVLNAEDKKCSGSTSAEIADAFFPGPACQAGGGAANPEECLQVAVRCDLCNSINSTFGTSADCDEFDNSVDDGSCGACRTANDQALIGDTDIGAIITILACAPAYDTACVGGALGGLMQEATCSQCYGSSLTCGATNCGSVCSGPDAEACSACLQTFACLDCL